MTKNTKLSSLEHIKTAITRAATQAGRQPCEIELLAVTKNQPENKIEPLLLAGQLIFGENRVQEAQGKWPHLKQKYPDTELHLIGHLQTNKVKEAVQLFDVIQTIDNLRLATKLHQEQQRQHKVLRYFIEVNIGNEPQKNGVAPDKFAEFYQNVRNKTNLQIVGIMCIPPQKQDPQPYFQEMAKIASRYHLLVSMGMSDDYEIAIRAGTNQVRIGRALFS